MNLDPGIVEQLLDGLDQGGYLFPQFKLHKVNCKLQCLGHGGFSVIYEMISKERLKHHFALKVIGLERHVVTSEDFWNTVRYQVIMCQESLHIVRILSAKEILVFLDEAGKLSGVYEVQNEMKKMSTEYKGELEIQQISYGPENEVWNDNGLQLQFILMEKLENILVRDKFKRVFFSYRE